MVEGKGDSMRSLKDSFHAMVDTTMVLMIGIAFVAMMIFAYLIWTLQDEIAVTPGATSSAAENSTFYSVQNVTNGFDSAINLILVAITIFILAIAISALLMLRGRR